MSPEEMIREHERRHNVMVGHYWRELAEDMGAEIKRLTRENRQLKKEVMAAINVATRIKLNAAR